MTFHLRGAVAGQSAGGEVLEPQSYEWQLQQLAATTPGTAPVWKIVDSGEQARTPATSNPETTQKTVSRTEGLYYFRFRVKNCSAAESSASPWAGHLFAVVRPSSTVLKELDDRRNHEELCECGCVPPGTTIGDATVESDSGNLFVRAASVFGSLAGALGEYLAPMYSQSSAEVTAYATVPMFAQPTKLSGSIEIRDESETVVYTAPLNINSSAAATVEWHQNAVPTPTTRRIS